MTKRQEDPPCHLKVLQTESAPVNIGESTPYGEGRERRRSALGVNWGPCVHALSSLHPTQPVSMSPQQTLSSDFELEDFGYQ